MFNIGMGEGVVLVLAVLIVMGPERLPGLARNLGKIMRDLRRETDEVRGSVLREIYRLQDDLNSDVELPRRPAIAARAMAILNRTEVADPAKPPPAEQTEKTEPTIRPQPAEGAIARNAAPVGGSAQDEGTAGPLEQSKERGVEGPADPGPSTPAPRASAQGEPPSSPAVSGSTPAEPGERAPTGTESVEGVERR